MKQVIIERLKRYPDFFSLLRKIYRAPYSSLLKKFKKKILKPKPLQKSILKNLKQKDSIFFVQVGSNDGIRGDPLHDIIVTNKHWKGIFIEPVEYLFERLVHNYGSSDRFIFEKQAIAPSRGQVEFFYVSEKAKAELGDALPLWYDQLGSFDKKHILKHLDGILEPYILSDKINTIPLQGLLDKHKVTRVDLIHIDAESYDYKVLTTIDFSRCRPSVILFEHKHLSDADMKSAKLLLKKNGYRCVLYGSDTLATFCG